MFQKKDYIYSETMGVCLVSDITNLALRKGNAVPYYVLRSVYQKDKVAYIPVEKHTVELRGLITAEQARTLVREWEQSEDEELKEQMRSFADFEMRLKMADTLSPEIRELLYQKGEVEFVLKQEKLKTEGENDKKKKGYNKTVTTV